MNAEQMCTEFMREISKCGARGAQPCRGTFASPAHILGWDFLKIIQ